MAIDQDTIQAILRELSVASRVNRSRTSGVSTQSIVIVIIICVSASAASGGDQTGRAGYWWHIGRDDALPSLNYVLAELIWLNVVYVA